MRRIWQCLLEEIEALSGVAPLYFSLDLGTSAGCETLIESTLTQLHRVDVLVNNAGIQHVCPLVDFPEDTWQKILNLNLTAAFLLSKGVLPGMYARGSGRLIHMASAHGLVASVHKGAYVAAKHGLLGLSKTIALESAGRGVTSNCICPGWVLTPLVEKQIQDKAAAQGVSVSEAQNALLREKQPSGEFATPEQLGELAVFLASPAASQITGAAVSMDGGWTAV